ncbi:MAG TPA: hypothetical protein VIP77_16195 [Jiangellaceae bacterium]
MAAVSSQSIVNTGTTPAQITPAASDTIAPGQFGAIGCVIRVATTGTATDVNVSDPGFTPSGNVAGGTPQAGRVISCPATGIRTIFIPPTAVDQSAGFATITFSGVRTGVTYELYRI